MLAPLLLAFAADELQLARGYFERGMFEEAASAFASEPAQTEETRFSRAEALYRARKWKDALEAFDEFLKTHARSKRTQLASLRKAICLAASGDKAQSRKELEKLKLRGQMADVAAYYVHFSGGKAPEGQGPYSCLARGETALDAGKYDRAAEEFSSALKSAPKTLLPRVRLVMAEARRLKGETGAAEELYSELSASSSLVSLGLAACKLSRGEFAAALELASKVDSPDAAYLRAASLLGLGKFSESARALALAGLDLAGEKLLLRIVAVYCSGRAEEAGELAGGLKGPWPEFIRAEGLRAQGKRARAAELYSHVEDAELKPYAVFGLASCAFDGGEYDEAAGLFMKVSEPRLKDVALVRAGEAFLLAKKPKRAEEALARVPENSDLHPRAQWRLCVAAHATADWRALIRRSRRLVSSHPGSHEARHARYWLARAHAALGEWESASKALKTLLDSGAGELEERAKNELAVALFKLGKPDEAERAWRKLKPGALAGETLLWLGRRSLGREDAKRAKEDFGLAAKAASDEIRCRALYEMGALFLKEGETDRADDHLARALALRPGSPLRAKARLARGKVLLAKEKFEEAESLFSNVVAEAEGIERGEAYLGLGKLFFKRRELPRARDAFMKVVVLFPGAPESLRAEALLGAGKAFDALGVHGKASQCYNEILEHYPGSPQASEARRLLGG